MKKIYLAMLAIATLFASCSKEDNNTITGLSISTDESKGRFELSWDQGDIDDVVIYRAEGDAAPVMYAETRYHQKFYDEDIEIGKTYTYKVVSEEPAGIESEKISKVCPEFSTRLGEIRARQDGKHIAFTCKVRFAKADEQLTVRISTTNNTWSEKVAVVNGEAKISHLYGAKADQYNYYNITLLNGTESIETQDYKVYSEHTYELAPSNVQVTVTNKAAKQIKVSWTAAKEATGYIMVGKVGEKTLKSEGTAETSIEVTFPSDVTLNDGDKIEFYVTGFADFNGKQYTSDSETIELTW